MNFFNLFTIEVIIMILNIGVLITLVVNIIIIKWNLLDCAAKRIPFCHRRGCGDKDTKTKMASAIVPIISSLEVDDENNEDDRADDVDDFDTDRFRRADELVRDGEQQTTLRRLSSNSVKMVKRVQTQYERGQRELHHKLGERQLRAQRKTQLRLAARRKLKHSKALRKIAAFKSLGVASLDRVIERMSVFSAEQGQVIVQEGAAADNFFVCISGHCSVWKRLSHSSSKEVKVGTIRPLEFFGESMMMGDATVRSATVRADSDGVVSLMVLSRQVWESLLDRGEEGGGAEVGPVLTQLEQVQEARRQRNARAMAGRRE